MLKILLSICLIASLQTEGKTPLSDEVKTKRLFEEIVKTVIPISRKYTHNIDGFSVHNCRGNRKKWLGLATIGQSFEQSFDFHEDCDLKGKYTPLIDQKFPVKFQLQKFGSFKSVEMEVVLKLKKELNFDIQLTATNGFVTDKDGRKIKFEGDYRIVVSPFSKDFVEKNYGGNYRCSQWDKEKLTFKDKFQIAKKSSKQ